MIIIIIWSSDRKRWIIMFYMYIIKNRMRRGVKYAIGWGFKVVDIRDRIPFNVVSPADDKEPDKKHAILYHHSMRGLEVT